MGTISYTIPVAGSTLNSVADPEIATALQTLLTLLNGNVDTNNLSPTANITASQLKSVFSSGLVGARPAAASAGGQFYYATDTGLLYWSNAAVWTTVSAPTAAGLWQGLTLNSGVGAYAGAYTPSARLDAGGDTVRFKGTLQNNSGANFSQGASVFSVPVGMANTQSGVNIDIPVVTPGGAGVFLSVAGGGTLFTFNSNGGAWSNGGALKLDGVTYTIS